MKIFLIIVAIIVLWSIWGYYSSNVEQAVYSVMKKADGYEIREYPAHIAAQTTVEGSYDDALNEGFGIIAGYIFGGNSKKQGISMTAPVTAQESVSEKIAMTAPVVASTEGGSRVISFVMPKSYTLESLPVPNDSRVKLVQVPEKKMAALRFSWTRNSGRVQKMEDQLLAMLSRDKVEVVGAPAYAGYNAPWTPPWMTRNEVLVEIK
ncbi:MAG: heme-binding protein [bacterium]